MQFYFEELSNWSPVDSSLASRGGEQATGGRTGGNDRSEGGRGKQDCRKGSGKDRGTEERLDGREI